jgi:hypothetical protein
MDEVCVKSVVSKATEIATAKVYEVMQMTTQGQWQKCLAATATDSALCCCTVYALLVSPPAVWD